MLKKIIYICIVFLIVYCQFLPNTCNALYEAGTGGGGGGLFDLPNKGEIDNIIDEADDFINIGLENAGTVINIGNIQITSNFIYNILLTIAIVVAIIWGMILGVQFLIGSAEQRAETKKALAPYLVGCVVIFGAFGIWAFVVNILQSIN